MAKSGRIQETVEAVDDILSMMQEMREKMSRLRATKEPGSHAHDVAGEILENIDDWAEQVTGDRDGMKGKD